MSRRYSVGRRGQMSRRDRYVIAVNAVLIVLETVALVHDIASFGAGLFRWYTVDSNVLQLIVSCLVVRDCMKRPGGEISGLVTTLHFISAVGLTVTFLIAAFVLAPEGGFAYYFLNNVAPINHFLAPLLSVISLLFLERSEQLPRKIILYPAGATLLYGVTALILNAAGVMEGPYFFLMVGQVPAGTIVLWFGIIAALCLGLGALCRAVRSRQRK